jgi:hypothetical protein
LAASAAAIPWPGLGLHTGLERRGHDEEGVHAPGGPLYGGGLFEVPFCQFRAETLERLGLG